MLYLLVEISSISPPLGHQLGVDVLGTTIRPCRSMRSPLPAQPPCCSFTLKSLTRVFLLS